MNCQGIDFLGCSEFCATIEGPGAPRIVENANALPSALLPLSSGERLEGIDPTLHRRGRGLAWPPESQVPVLGDTANGAGRVLLASAFERLCRAETSWGYLEDTQFSWKPDGEREVALEAGKLIAAQLRRLITTAGSVGLVVPDTLGVAGQSAILSAANDSRLLLVPHSIAAAISWCRENPALADAGQTSVYAGHLTVVEAGLGHWSICRIPVRRETLGMGRVLIPVHLQRLKSTGLATTGASMLASALEKEAWDLLRLGWQRRALAGAIEASLARPRRAMTSRLASLRDLDGNHLLETALSELAGRAPRVSAADEFSLSLGLIVTGAMAQVRLGTRPLKEEISRHLNLPLLELRPNSPACGAALAARGVDSDEPTWLEQLEQLDLHYIGKSTEGDAQSAWKNVLPEQLLKAGTEWRNEAPITGLKLQTGKRSIRITIRRPDPTRKWQYRSVESTNGASADEDLPLEVNVLARPGQGFAVVRVDSRDAGRFSSQLDWNRMVVCDEPAPPKLAYVVRSCELVVSRSLWSECVPPLIRFQSALKNPGYSALVIERAKDVCRALRKLTPFTASGAVQSDEDLYRLYAPLDREGRTCVTAGQNLLTEVAHAAETRLHSKRCDETERDWLRRLLACLRGGCPAPVSAAAKRKLSSHPADCTAVDLLVAGMSFATPDAWLIFYAGFDLAIKDTKRPNAWMKALRDIVKFNERALAELDARYATKLYGLILLRLRTELEQAKPVNSQSCFETLLLFLKCRRYYPDFATVGTPLFDRSVGMIGLADETWPKRRRPAKLGDVMARFTKFLNKEGDHADVAGTLMADEGDTDD